MFRIFIIVCVVLFLVACDEGPSQAEAPEPAGSEDAGFEAVISGSYEGEVRGPAYSNFFLKRDFEKQGYYFLSDGQGIRPHGVTFVLPRRLAPGKYRLESPSPLTIGQCLQFGGSGQGRFSALL